MAVWVRAQQKHDVPNAKGREDQGSETEKRKRFMSRAEPLQREKNVLAESRVPLVCARKVREE